MCTFLNLGRSQSSAQGGIVLVLVKASSGVISLLASSFLLSIWSHGQVELLLSLCVRIVFWNGCFYIEYMVVVVCLKCFYTNLECV